MIKKTFFNKKFHTQKYMITKHIIPKFSQSFFFLFVIRICIFRFPRWPEKNFLGIFFLVDNIFSYFEQNNKFFDPQDGAHLSQKYVFWPHIFFGNFFLPIYGIIFLVISSKTVYFSIRKMALICLKNIFFSTPIFFLT